MLNIDILVFWPFLPEFVGSLSLTEMHSRASHVLQSAIKEYAPSDFIILKFLDALYS